MAFTSVILSVAGLAFALPTVGAASSTQTATVSQSKLDISTDSALVPGPSPADSSPVSKCSFEWLKFVEAVAVGVCCERLLLFGPRPNSSIYCGISSSMSSSSTLSTSARIQLCNRRSISSIATKHLLLRPYCTTFTLLITFWAGSLNYPITKSKGRLSKLQNGGRYRNVPKVGGPFRNFPCYI